MSRREDGVVEVTVIEYDGSTWTIGTSFGYIFTHTNTGTHTHTQPFMVRKTEPQQTPTEHDVTAERETGLDSETGQ